MDGSQGRSVRRCLCPDDAWHPPRARCPTSAPADHRPGAARAHRRARSGPEPTRSRPTTGLLRHRHRQPRPPNAARSRIWGRFAQTGPFGGSAPPPAPTPPPAPAVPEPEPPKPAPPPPPPPPSFRFRAAPASETPKPPPAAATSRRPAHALFQLRTSRLRSGPGPLPSHRRGRRRWPRPTSPGRASQRLRPQPRGRSRRLTRLW